MQLKSMTPKAETPTETPRAAWRRFGARALGARLAKSPTPAVELLVAGTVLGPACMLDLIAAHHDQIDDAIVTLDDVLVPGLATVRSDSGTLLLRLLGRHAHAPTVDALQAAFAQGRHTFHLLRADGASPDEVDALFTALVTLQIDAGQGRLHAPSGQTALIEEPD